MYTRNQLQEITGLNARQLRTRLEALSISPLIRGRYHKQHLQLILLYEPSNVRNFKIHIYESSLNLTDYENEL